MKRKQTARAEIVLSTDMLHKLGDTNDRRRI